MSDMHFPFTVFDVIRRATQTRGIFTAMRRL